MRRTSVSAAGGNLGAEQIYFARAFEIPKGGGRLRRPEPKKKDTTFVVSFFLQRTVKIDIFVWGQRGPQLTKQDRSAECQFPAQG